MKYKIPTKKAGSLELPVLGLGTYRLGGRYQLRGDYSVDKGAELIHQAFQLGYTHFDTAERYVYGKAEEMIGKAIQTGLPRGEVFITTKVAGNHLQHDQVIEAAESSLERLQIEQIDLYLVHWPDKSVPLEETMQAMDALAEKGLVKFIGVSNFDVSLLEEASSASEHKIVNNQIHYNVAARAYEENGTLEYCRDNNILVTAYGPLGEVATGNLAHSENEILQRLSKKYDKTPAQVCINWLASRPNVITLVKSSTPQHLEENIQAVLFEMDDADLQELKTDFPRSETNVVR